MATSTFSQRGKIEILQNEKDETRKAHIFLFSQFSQLVSLVKMEFDVDIQIENETARQLIWQVS